MLHSSRLLHHLWLDEADARRAVPPDLAQRLARLVAESEARHEGEVRLCVEGSLPISYLWRHVRRRQPMPQVLRERALMLFAKLRVWDTRQRNGVLVYLNLAARAIEIVPDRGLAERAPPPEWAAVSERLAGALGAGRFEEGLTNALAEVTALLEKHFPEPPDAACRPAPDNQLPDAVVLC